MQIVIDLSEDECARAAAALGALWDLNDVDEQPRKLAGREETVIDRVSTRRPATEEEIAEFCIKHLRGMVHKHEDRIAASASSPAPFKGK